MKRFYIITLLAFFCLSNNIIAQEPNLLWANRMGGAGNDYGYSMAVDANGNVYTTGTFANTADFDPGIDAYNLTSVGDVDIFVTKFDNSGNLLWARRAGGVSSDLSKSIAIDANGNVLVTGYFISPIITFGSTTLTNSGNTDILVLKFDASGNALWANSAGGAFQDMGNEISTDANGNVLVTGWFEDSITFGSIILRGSSRRGFDFFVVKYDASGNTLWANSVGGSGYSDDKGGHIITDANGNVYVSGTFGRSSLDTPSITFGTTTLTGQWFGGNIFVAKLDVTGNFVWAKHFGSPSDVGPSIAVDGNGNVYTTESALGASDFDPGPGIHNLIAVNLYDIFVSKLDASGNFLWAKLLGGTGFNDLSHSIAVDANGNVYTTGFFEGEADFDPSDTGIYDVKSVGLYDIFVSKLDASGNFLWAKRMGGANKDESNSIAVDVSGNVYTTGYFDGTADFDPGPRFYNLTSRGGSDIFIVKLGQNSSCAGVSISTQPINQTATVGGTATFSVVAGGTSPYTYQWRKNGVDINGENSDSYTTPALTLTDNGNSYSCYITNCSGSYSVTSSDATLTVNSGCTTPTTQASNISFPSISTNQITINWTRGGGTAGVIVVARLTTTANVDPTNGTPYTANAAFGSGSTTGAGNYVVYKGTSTSVNVTGLTCNTGYTFTVYEYNTPGTCYKIPGSSSVIATDACISQTILITSSHIPPWQRQNDSFDGSVAVLTSNPSGASWHLEIFKNGSWIKSFTSTTNTTTLFNSTDFGVSLISGDMVTYKAVLDANGVIASPYSVNNIPNGNSETKIINKKLDLETVVYYNDGFDGDEIKIPIEFIPSTNYNNVTVQLTRVPKTAAIGMLSLSDLLSDPPTISSTTGQFSVSPTIPGFCLIKNSNSDIEDAYPGEFIYKVYNGNNLLETGHFSLVKIGRKGTSWNNNSSHVVVGIGGIYNTLEESIKKLSFISPYVGSEDSYSLLAYLGDNSDANIWYIAQGNVNGVRRNGYDLGVALERIKTITNATEIDIVCHSKGGLDTRAFIQNKSVGLNGTIKSFSTSGVASTLKKIVFLGTPHRGSETGALLSALVVFVPKANLFNNFISGELAQGLYDLVNTNMLIKGSILYDLNHSTVPSSISYANLTGFLKIWPLPTDVWVDINSSENPIIGSIQMYQDKGYHLNLHKNKFLSQNGECSESNTNLDKILNFISNNNVASCERSLWKFQTSVNGSVLPGALISFKRISDSSFVPITLTDENGKIEIIPFYQLSLGDSIKIEASGYETLVLAVDATILSTAKIEVSMLKSTNPTNKIKYPSLKLVNHNPITANSPITMEANGQNVLRYEINSPFNQDTLFVPLTLGNNQFTTELDTGYNKILVRFIGQQDTVTLLKEINYLPGSLTGQFTYNVSITANSASLGAKIYVNNQFVKQVNSFTDTIPVLFGQNIFKFTKFGYVDSLVTVDSAATISLSLQLFPYSYSSPSDSNIVDFPLLGKLQYRRNVTMLDSAQASVIAIKQYDDNFPGKALIPKSRKFEFRHLNAPTWSNIKTAMVLDQIENLSVDSIYLLKISDDTTFTKIAFDNTDNKAGYDSLVQKLTYNYITFDSGNAKKETLVIMKKLLPIVKNIPALSVNENGSLSIPLSQFFSDPDSVHNDMMFQIPNANPTGSHLSISNENLVLNTNPCYSGNTSFSIQATHDGLAVSNTVNITVIATPPPVITENGSVTFCAGNNIILTSNVVSGNQWYKDGVAINDSTRTTMNVTASGSYTAKVTENTCESAASNAIVVTVNPIPVPPTITAGTATTICTGGSLTLTSNEANGNQWYKDGIALSDSIRSTVNVTANGSYTAKVIVDNCESAVSNAIVVTVNPVPVTPTITQNTNQLVSSAASGNQWYLNNAVIAGATGQNYTPTASGNYTVRVTSNNCASAFSNAFAYIFTGIQNIDAFGNQVKVVPNPVEDKLIIIRSNPASVLNIQLFDINGRQLKTFTSSLSRTEINMTKYAAGLYIIRIEDRRNKILGKKVIVKLK